MSYYECDDGYGPGHGELVRRHEEFLKRHSDAFVKSAKAGQMFVFKLGTFDSYGTMFYNDPFQYSLRNWVSNWFTADPYYPVLFLGDVKLDGEKRRWVKFLVTTPIDLQKVGWLEDVYLKDLGRYER